MNPTYIKQLADIADPDELWRLPPMQQLDLPPEKRRQLDAGVALRRHAHDVQQLRDLIGTGRSLLLTPLSVNGRRSTTIPTPQDQRHDHTVY